MRKVLHWRKATWALVLWSGYLATWMVLTSSGPAIAVLWWLAGLGLLQLIMQLYKTGRIEPSRRHGPFGPRFSPRPDPPLPLATNDDLRTTPEQANLGAVRHRDDAVQDWESEGGAIVEPLRANPTAQVA